MTEQELAWTYPVIFRRHPAILGAADEASCMSDGLQVGDGWLPLLDRMCLALCDAGLGGLIVAAQVKEKFGGLRFYFDAERQLTQAEMRLAKYITKAAETESLLTCEECGETDDVTANEKGYVRTLCPACREKVPHAD